MFHVKQESPYDDELQIEPYFNPPVACHDYDPDAPEVAQRVALMVTHRLPTLTVEHVGSSSVPGCAGKGVIDLMLLYPPGQLEEAKGVLAELGFQRQTSRDPFPEDRPMRTGSVQYQGKRGSGSPKEASSFQVVAMEKEAQASFMHEKRF
jgi:GrpB-like predicted nucleotidyltransferase (UPF0157 family)